MIKDAWWWGDDLWAVPVWEPLYRKDTGHAVPRPYRAGGTWWAETSTAVIIGPGGTYVIGCPDGELAEEIRAVVDRRRGRLMAEARRWIRQRARADIEEYDNATELIE